MGVKLACHTQCGAGACRMHASMLADVCGLLLLVGSACQVACWGLAAAALLMLLLPWLLVAAVVAGTGLALQFTCGTAGMNVRPQDQTYILIYALKVLTELMANSSAGSTP